MREAGALAASTFQTALKTWTKHGGSPVSEADIAVDKLLRQRLMALAPDAGWLSEESEDDRARLRAPHLWVVDPIDGTRAYVTGRTDWSISVALVTKGRPVIAAVYAPIQENFYAASAGEGTTLNGVPVRASAGVRGERSIAMRGTGSRVPGGSRVAGGDYEAFVARWTGDPDLNRSPAIVWLRR